ncbi:hypothetical protein NDU88_001162 [Pleurodeles waltl]|uniref:Uncharacterized protein n=1 Tax=Pleurodeles waltl TaxID=8319 RepID=A0AAV7V721_PLEWA|nr:hypothetical protein NDU88_001162 [Pleurodeles waltl]
MVGARLLYSEGKADGRRRVREGALLPLRTLPEALPGSAVPEPAVGERQGLSWQRVDERRRNYGGPSREVHPPPRTHPPGMLT